MNKKIKLSTELDSGKVETYDLFGSSFDFVKKEAEKNMSKSIVNSNFISKSEVPCLESERQLKKQRKAEREKTKGKDWFNMGAGEMTEEAKNDLAVIKMRGALHKDRFYKSNDSETLPKFFQMGTIVDDPLDYYTTRVTRKEKKNTILEEFLEDAKIKKFAKKSYAVIQAKEERRRKHLARMGKRLKKK